MNFFDRGFSMAEHRLFFRDIEVGVITDDSYDFPRFYGRYLVSITGNESNVHQHIIDYVNYSVEAWKLASDENDTTGEAWDEYTAEHESKFVDLFDTKDWYVRSGSKDQCIRAPNFGPDGEVVWLWDFGND